MMKHKTNRRRLLAGIVAFMWLGFIWGNSMLPGADSAAVSGFLGELLAKMFGPKVLEAAFFLQKLAHFTEFSILGGVLAWNAGLWPVSSSVPVLTGLLAAMADETIQLFSPGRASMVQDVWIDFAGVLAGLLLFRLVARRRHLNSDKAPQVSESFKYP